MSDPFRKKKPKSKRMSLCCHVPFTLTNKEVRCSKCKRRYALSGSVDELEVVEEQEENTDVEEVSEEPREHPGVAG